VKTSQTIILLFIFLYPIIFFGSDGRIEKKKFGPYLVVLSQSFKDGLGKVIIAKDKVKVFESAEIEDHYYFGNHFDGNDVEKDLYSGRDITGKGVSNLLISNWTGGAHCCNFLHIFELGKKLKKLITVEANSSTIHLVDLDHDGFPEIVFEDGAIDYLFNCFALSPGGRVVLKFKNDHYEVATQPMVRPLPISNQIKKIKSSFVKEKDPVLPYDFLKEMMDLSYSGHFELAKKMANDVWPTNKPGLSKFLEEFSNALNESLYWKHINQDSRE
jgi:hypothetical protein